MRKILLSVFKITGIPILIASLCCLTPVVLMTLGLGSAAFAASLADTLYGSYKWVFRGIGLICLGISFVWYLRREKNICTFNQVLRRHNEVLNLLGLSLLVGVLGYVVWLYGVVEITGKIMHIW